MKKEKFKCADCGTEINERNFKSFGVCYSCFDKGVSQSLWEPKHKHNDLSGDSEYIIFRKWFDSQHDRFYSKQPHSDRQIAYAAFLYGRHQLKSQS